MSAAQAREELEAATWRAGGRYPDIDRIAAVMRAADAYATAVADERIARYDDAARVRLQAATAEYYGASR